MIRLMRALGSAVIVGAGVKAGGDLYSALRRRFTGEEAGTGADARSPIDEILGSDDDVATKEARLEAERARIEAELERLRKAHQADPKKA